MGSIPAFPGWRCSWDFPLARLATELKAIDTAARDALRDFRALEPERIVPVLRDWPARHSRRACRRCNRRPAPADARADVDFVLARKETDFAEALAQAAGIVVDPLSDEETVVPGGSVDVNVRTFLEHADLATVTAPSCSTRRPDGGSSQAQAGERAAASAASRRPRLTRYHVTAPVDATLTAAVLSRETSSRQPLRLAGGRAARLAVRAAAAVSQRDVQRPTEPSSRSRGRCATALRIAFAASFVAI